MPINWKEAKIFHRDTSIYTFSNNPLLRRNRTIHAYIPWTKDHDEELMYKLKAVLANEELAYIPFMDMNQESASFESENEVDNFKDQSSGNLYETHLIMCNGEAIHIFKVEDVVNTSNLPKKFNTDQNIFKNSQEKYKNWFVVSDVFVYSVNHIDNIEEISKDLENLIEGNQTQNIFTGRDSLDSSHQPGRWVGLNRNVTYDYFIKSCELKDNVYQDMWEYLSRRAQHSLIISDLERSKCVFFRGTEKWEHLVESFESYKGALTIELNELYIAPLNIAIQEYKTLADAWDNIKTASINLKSIEALEQVISGKRESVETLEEFIGLAKNVKSMFFSLKTQFSKKLFMEEHLLVENFLGRNESLFDSFQCRHLDKQILAIIEIENWIKTVNLSISEATSEELRVINSKLSHLISIMASASYQENIFFKLLEEKLGKGTVQKSFEDEVKSLAHHKFKKAA